MLDDAGETGLTRQRGSLTLAAAVYRSGRLVVLAPAMEQAASEGAFATRAEALVKAFTGRPRAMVLSGIALFHPAGHLGEAVTVRGAGAFGTGV